MRTSGRPTLRKRSIGLCGVSLLMPLAAAAQSLPTAAQVADRIAVGWNIGNTMEVPGGETGWGNPAVNQQLIDGIKAAGFNAVRIPCAWDSHANSTTHQIDSAWLARVRQVVDYCIANGMVVILNIHWDGGWLENHVLSTDQKAVNEKQKTYWTQIATYFKSYDEHLLFAGTNEVHQDYNTPTSEHIAVQQSYLQTFVDAVRATGGNNATRPLVVQTYNTHIGHGLNYFTLPKDTAQNRLLVEVHFYDPYDYTINKDGSCLYWGTRYPSQSACTWGQESHVDDQFSKIKAKWVDKGIPVIIGEYGVLKRTSLSGQQLADRLASRQYYLKYVNAAAAKNGIKTFYWDNGVKDEFALVDRNNGAVIDQGALDAVMQGVGATTQALSVAKSGAGSGTVTSSPSGVSCGSSCSAHFSAGTSVTLTATADSGSIFAGWSGACTGTGPCTVSMTAAKSVTATFDRTSGATYALSVAKSGAGSGTVTSSPSGVSCGSSCSTNFESGTSVTLTATADSGSIFAGWSGACAGTGTCTVSMTAAKSVTATFDRTSGATYALSVAKSGAGSGTVTSSPSGVSCGSSCSTNFESGTSVTLTATADSGSVFAGWSGACTGTSTCTVSITEARSVTATFALDKTNGVGATYALSVAKSGAGSGTVTSSPSGVSCGSTCRSNFESGTSVTLTATAVPDSTFAGWSGACTGTSTCTVSMTEARSVTATFALDGMKGAFGCGQAGAAVLPLVVPSLVPWLIRRHRPRRGGWERRQTQAD